VVRQEIKRRPKATGKQLSLFQDDDYGKEYRHPLYVTNDHTASPYDIWGYYRPRANVENIIETLKDGFGLSASNLKNFWATEALQRLRNMRLTCYCNAIDEKEVA
jgi:hypothetical protein